MNEQQLVAGLDSFDPTERRRALEALQAVAAPDPGGNVNMHIHSFHSFNGWDYSPSHIAHRARSEGLYAVALCDFDVLDGMEEFLEAGEIAGLRTAVHLETRAYLQEFGDVDINSPGEAGVTYIMGAGFVHYPEEGSAAARTLQGFRDQAHRRNRELIGRVNAALPDIAVEYGSHVLPLTPGGNATERHIIRAYVERARAAVPARLSSYWAEVLRRPAGEIERLLEDRPAFEEAVRARLVKRGGVGYEPPTPRTFPPADDFVAWVAECGAVPMVAWLDGTSAGEADPRPLLDCLRAKGCAAVNIIPDRNWNLPAPGEAQLVRRKLGEFVSACEELELPINIGTEMNKRGVPFVDDLSVPALKPFAETFRSGARIMVGHSIMARFGSRGDRPCNDLLEKIGGLAPLTGRESRRLREMGAERAHAALHDSAACGFWRL